MNATVEAFLEKSKLNYTVRKEPATQRTWDENGPTDQFEEVEGQYHLVRSTDNVVISPATVSDRYAPLNPRQLVAPLEPLVAEGWITPDNGHRFKRGSFEVITFRVDAGQLENDGKVVGEDWDHYLSIHNHQGGGGKVRGLLHSTRRICSNAIVRLAQKNGFALRHTGELQANYDWAVSTWKKLKDEIRELSTTMEAFAAHEVTVKEAEQILFEIYGVKGQTKDEIGTRTWNELDFAVGQFANPRLGTYGKTYADVLNAITATNTHYAPKGSKESDEKRLASLYDEQGSRNKLEATAVSVLRKLAELN